MFTGSFYAFLQLTFCKSFILKSSSIHGTLQRRCREVRVPPGPRPQLHTEAVVEARPRHRSRTPHAPIRVTCNRRRSRVTPDQCHDGLGAPPASPPPASPPPRPAPACFPAPRPRHAESCGCLGLGGQAEPRVPLGPLLSLLRHLREPCRWRPVSGSPFGPRGGSFHGNAAPGSHGPPALSRRLRSHTRTGVSVGPFFKTRRAKRRHRSAECVRRRRTRSHSRVRLPHRVFPLAAPERGHGERRLVFP